MHITETVFREISWGLVGVDTRVEYMSNHILWQKGRGKLRFLAPKYEANNHCVKHHTEYLMLWAVLTGIELVRTCTHGVRQVRSMLTAIGTCT